MAGAEGFEPSTLGFGDRCSTAELYPCACAVLSENRPKRKGFFVAPPLERIRPWAYPLGAKITCILFSSPWCVMIASAQLQKSFPQTLTAPERDFGQRFFAQIDADDLAALPPAQVGAIIKDQFKLCARKRFETKMSFSTNDKKGMAWAARRTYLNIVTDDLAFLVDSVAAYLAEKRLMVDLLLRPRLSISYTDKGQAALDPAWPRTTGPSAHCPTRDLEQNSTIRYPRWIIGRDQRRPGCHTRLAGDAPPRD
jgi:hypothetical protein